MGLFSKDPEISTGGGAKPLNGTEAGAVTAASEQVKSKRGGFRPGSGRKPGSANGTAKVVGEAAPGKPDENQAQASEADIEFVKTVAESALKIIDRIETNVIEKMIAAIDDKYITERTDAYLKQREIGPGDIEVVVNACGALAAKYSFLSRYAPEAALLSWASIHYMAFHGVTSDLKKLAKIVKEMKVKGVKDENNAGPPQAN